MHPLLARNPTGGQGPTPGAYTGFTPAAHTPGLDLAHDAQGGGLSGVGSAGGGAQADLQLWAGVVVQVREGKREGGKEKSTHVVG